jgi:predicted TIM-barrel fold metal-dependent hydrolase
MTFLTSGVVDTMIGIRSERLVAEVPALRQAEKADHHPHGYMFKAIPAELAADEDVDAAIDETIARMDAHGIEYGILNLDEELSPRAYARHPARFVPTMYADGNRGMDQIRDIVRAKEQFDIRAVGTFPSGVWPQIPINDKLWYPLYAKCVELDIPVLITAGVPGPRIKMMAQHVELFDEVCYDFPELKIIMRHGADPWTELAVKLMLKWPNLYYSTSAWSPKHIPEPIIKFANSRGADKIIYAGYYPYGLELERIFKELKELPLKPEVLPKFLSDNARKLFKLPPRN